MAHENMRVHDYYLPMHDLQHPPHFYHPFGHSVPAYELTVEAAGAVAVACAQANTASAQHHQHHEHRKRTSSRYKSGSVYDDDTTEDSSSSRTVSDKKQNHSEIEKRRRDKMNTYISELSAMIPMCGAMSRKLDKLTVLRMAVQHLRSVRGALSAGPLTARPIPAFISETELNSLVLHAAKDCFLMVVGCDRGRLIYVSASVTQMLYYEQTELLGQSLFDILHPKDVAKVKEQLSSSDLSPRERLIDAKTMLPVKADVIAGASRFCPGARRSFFCRIKCKPNAFASVASSAQSNVKDESEPTAKLRKKQGPEKKYCVVQCTGYLKSWAPVELSEAGGIDPGPDDGDANNLSCLVAVGRALNDLTPTQLTTTSPTTNTNNFVPQQNDGKYAYNMENKSRAKEMDCLVPNEVTEVQSQEDYDVYKQSYMKSWVTSNLSEGRSSDAGSGNSDMPCMTVGQNLNDISLNNNSGPLLRPLQYISRHATDGKFLFVDQRVTLALGFLPQELLGSSLYEYVSGPELGAVARTHKASLLRRDPLRTPPYNFRRKDGAYVRIQTHFKPFRNPWTKDVECLVANNIVVTDLQKQLCEEDCRRFNVFKDNGAAYGDSRSAVSEADLEMQRLIDSQVESHKIGSTIAEEALRRTSRDPSPELPVDLLQDAVFSQGATFDNILSAESSFQVRNNVPLSAAANSPSPELRASPQPPSPSLDGNGEAAMAVIMSLLEADAGLGGPVNFASLPWPLP
ncbi:protein cycle isoform X3 [Aricia agestis]|uniref:protein cycle isoform X3 n=1 Tax=Aricia agestis TaxID=91739 RepID=UPI001C203CD6|nr:protein cycle isoform X3 [Aricia agestis]XP_041986558.1 protein cycle isoform X3 [Aricia agestis]